MIASIIAPSLRFKFRQLEKGGIPVKVPQAITIEYMKLKVPLKGSYYGVKVPVDLIKRVFGDAETFIMKGVFNDHSIIIVPERPSDEKEAIYIARTKHSNFYYIIFPQHINIVKKDAYRVSFYEYYIVITDINPENVIIPEMVQNDEDASDNQLW